MQRIPRNLEELKRGIAVARTKTDPADESVSRFLQGVEYEYRHTGPVPDRIKWPSYFSSDRDLRDRRRADWQLVDPRIAEFAFRFLLLMQTIEIPFFVHCAYRTRKEQNAAVQRGNSKTPWPRASHCQGQAIDIIHSRYAWELSPPEWAWIGLVGKQLHADMMAKLPPDQRWLITWGGDWRSPYDPAHWEIRDWRTNIRIPVETTPVVLDYSPKAAVRGQVWQRLPASKNFANKNPLSKA